jgi:hypothetical protein
VNLVIWFTINATTPLPLYKNAVDKTTFSHNNVDYRIGCKVALVVNKADHGML